MKNELERLREIEHLAWHAAESAEDQGEHFIVPEDTFRALCKALPMEHPSHDALPKRAKR